MYLGTHHMVPFSNGDNHRILEGINHNLDSSKFIDFLMLIGGW